MKTTTTVSLAALTISLACLGTAACSDEPMPGPATGGSPATSGGAPSTGGGGATSGGASTSGGLASGGAATGGVSSGGAAGGGAGGVGGGATPGTFAEVSKILHNNCGLSCHAPGTEQVNLSANSPDAAAQYMRLTTPLTTDLCNGTPPVTPGLGFQSLLSKAIRGPVTDPCVLPRMPNGCAPGTNFPCLSDADIATIQSWIVAGAKQQ